MIAGELAPMLPWSTRPLPHDPPQAPRGICRVCGCTPENACVVGTVQERPALPGAPGGALPAEVDTCSWVDPTLCSRCHSPRRPTRRQAGEIARIRYRFGRVEIRGHHAIGWLTVELVDQGPRDAWDRPTGMAPLVELSPRGAAAALGRRAGAGDAPRWGQLRRLMDQKGNR